MEAEEDDEEEDDGEDPQSDGHKHDPAVFRRVQVGGAGYQRPVDHPQELQPETNYTSAIGRKKFVLI